jgi:hypothetical protein
MALYHVLAKSFINNAIYEEGDTVEYSGEASNNLELVKKGKDQPTEDSVLKDAPLV